MSDRSARSSQIIEIDMERYQAMLDDPAMTEEHKAQVIEALWTIIVSFVDIGYGVHPIQQACGKLTEDKDQSGAESQHALEYEDVSPEQ